MTVAAEQILEKIKRLPPADLQDVCQAVVQMTAQTSFAKQSLQKNGSAAVAAEEEEADEASFFAALAELRERGTVRRDAPSLAQ